MSKGGRPSDSGRSARHASSAGNSGFAALFRNVLRSSFTKDSGDPAPLQKEPSLNRQPTSSSVGSEQQQPKQSEQCSIGSTTAEAGEAMAQAAGPPAAAVTSVDAKALALQQPGLMDEGGALEGRLDALQALLPEFRGKRLTNIAGLWRLLDGIVQYAFRSSSQNEQEPLSPPQPQPQPQSLSTDSELRPTARRLVLSLLVELADGEQKYSDFGDDAQQTRRDMLRVIASVSGWDEIALAVHCAAWASCDAQHLETDPMGWLRRAKEWSDQAVAQCYPEGMAREPLQGPPDYLCAILTASLEFLASIICEEYPVLDPDFVSTTTAGLCIQAAHTRPVAENGVAEVTWVWTEAEHLYGVLRLLKTVINYGALSQEVLRPGILLLCTTVNITMCKELCCDIVYTIFTSCYMRDALLAMNYILREGNSSQNSMHIYGMPTMTPHQAAVNGMVYYITQVMDTGPTGFQFSLRTGNCLPVLGKAAECMHPEVLRLVFPYLCSVVNDARADSMVFDDWRAVIGILETTIDCRLTDKYDDDLDSEDGGDDTERTSLAGLYDCVLSSITSAYRRKDTHTPNSLTRLLYRLRGVISDDIALDLLRFIDARGSLRPGATNWLETLEELMHIYYFDRSRSLPLRRYIISLCAKAFTEAADTHSFSIEQTPFVLSILDQLCMEEDSKVVDSVTSILLMGLTNTKDPEVFHRLMQFSMQAALDARYSRPKPSAPHGSDGAASGTLAHHIFQGTVHSSPPALPLLANDSTSMTDERAYSSYARVSTTAACLFCVLQRRMANTGYAGDDEYVQSSSIIIELANALLDLLESDHMFPSVQRDILSRFFRLHADSSSKLYFLQHGRDTVMDERVNLHENARFKLVSTRGAASGNSSSQQAAAVKFPVSRYVSILTSLFASSADLETYYALCQGLMQQLGNTYLFTICPEEMQALIVYLISHLRVATYSQDARVRLSAEEKNKVSAFSYGLLISAMHYKDLLKRDQQDALIAAFRDGLIVSSNASATPQICLHALSVSMLELPGAMVRLLSSILQQLVKIYSTPQISVHLLEFVSAISREQRLYANFRAQDYRMIFAVAINYIRFHNNQRRRENAPPTPVPGAGGAGAPKPGDSGVSPAVDPKRLSVGGGSASDSTSAKPSASDVALSQYVLVMAYQVIDVYYLSLSPSLKAETVNSLLQGLLQANLSRDSLDEANEVCLDMILQNFNKSSEDILSQGDVATKEDLGPVAERTWIQHNGIVTIRAQKSGPLAQIMVRSPSGTTSRVVDLPAEVARKYAERADLPTQSPPTGPATTADASVATTGATTPSGDAAAMPHSSPASTISRGSGRGRGTVRNRRLHSIAGPGAAGLGEADMLPPDTIARLLRGELAAAQSATSRAAHFPIRFGPAPCVAQEFITAYPMLQNIDPPVLLPTQSEAVSRSLRIFDITSTVDTHKVSVAYVGPGQTTEHEILLNQQGSPAYWNFLRGLGKITRLSGMKGYSAGLDTSGQDQDGRYTIKWRDLIAQLVFHVGTLMPAGETMSERMVRKKAHMGNDYVHIVFNESGRDYEFDTIPSEFNYVQIIVTPVDGRIPSHEVDSSWLHSDPGGAEAKFVQLYKVKTQVNANVPFVGPAMEPKLLTLTALPAFVRSVAIHAAIISQVYSDCKRNGGVGEFISPWRARLQAIKRIRSAAEREAAKQQQQSASAQSPAGSPLLDEKEEWPAGLHAPASQVLDHLTRELESFYNRA